MFIINYKLLPIVFFRIGIVVTSVLESDVPSPHATSLSQTKWNPRTRLQNAFTSVRDWAVSFLNKNFRLLLIISNSESEYEDWLKPRLLPCTSGAPQSACFSLVLGFRYPFLSIVRPPKSYGAR